VSAEVSSAQNALECPAFNISFICKIFIFDQTWVIPQIMALAPLIWVITEKLNFPSVNPDTIAY
jgi:hypothetical protein